ncbi:hypothetical protein FQA39_LY02073 [Lamprigera yunnana]|nr:hypothetical protein FQA39_LY02073 [Lamprigera yunnana]
MLLSLNMVWKLVLLLFAFEIGSINVWMILGNREVSSCCVGLDLDGYETLVIRNGHFRNIWPYLIMTSGLDVACAQRGVRRGTPSKKQSAPTRTQANRRAREFPQADHRNMFNTTFTRTTGLDVDSSSDAQQQYILDAIAAYITEKDTPRLKFSSHIMEDPGEFLKEMKGYFNAPAVPKSRRLKAANAALTKDAAAWWKLNQCFADSYEDFEEMVIDNYDSQQVWDQLSTQLGRRNKSNTETMSEFMAKKSALSRRLKLDDALHLPQLVEMFGPAVLPYLLPSQPAPPSHEDENSEATQNASPTGDEEAFQNNADAEVDEASEEEIEIHENDAEFESKNKRDVEFNVYPEVDETITDPEGGETVEEGAVGNERETPDSVAIEHEARPRAVRPRRIHSAPHPRRPPASTSRGARAKRDGRGSQPRPLDIRKGLSTSHVKRREPED